MSIRRSEQPLAAENALGTRLKLLFTAVTALAAVGAVVVATIALVKSIDQGNKNEQAINVERQEREKQLAYLQRQVTGEFRAILAPASVVSMTPKPFPKGRGVGEILTITISVINEGQGELGGQAYLWNRQSPSFVNRDCSRNSRITKKMVDSLIYKGAYSGIPPILPGGTKSVALTWYFPAKSFSSGGTQPNYQALVAKTRALLKGGICGALVYTDASGQSWQSTWLWPSLFGNLPPSDLVPAQSVRPS